MDWPLDVLIQHQGLNILTDLIFGGCQPIPIGGIERAQSAVPNIENLPAIDFVLISHSHYDHLDLPSLRTLGGKVQFWVQRIRLTGGFSPGFIQCSFA